MKDLVIKLPKHTAMGTDGESLLIYLNQTTAQSVLDQLAPPLQAQFSMEHVESIVSQAVGVPIYAMHRRNRSANIVKARWLCWALMKERGYDDEAIGHFFKLDRTTVIHGLSTFYKQVVDNPQLQMTLTNLRARL